MTSAVWYFARSAGIVAYLLLSSSVFVGVLLAGRERTSWPRFAVEEVHRFLAILTGVFVVLHGGSLLLDRVVPIGLSQELVPFSSPYRPFAVGLGVTAMELLAAVAVSNRYRRSIPHRLWRKLHYLTLPAWLLASLHGVLAGTDRADPWFAGVVAGASCAVAVAAAARFSPRRAPA
jgi:DMSO/TMAO reductase YedYZ heme-binding membrane subunit